MSDNNLKELKNSVAKETIEKVADLAKSLIDCLRTYCEKECIVKEEPNNVKSEGTGCGCNCSEKS